MSQKTDDLPYAVVRHLPERAQDIYLSAYIHAWSESENPMKQSPDSTREKCAHQIAWGVLKNKYRIRNRFKTRRFG